MFGNPMLVSLGGLDVVLRPPKKTELEYLSEKFSSMNVQRYLGRTFASTLMEEEKWWEHSADDSKSCVWAIEVAGTDKMIGTTGLHRLSLINGSAMSGIVIVDPSYWGRGIAYRAHLARTWYAVNILNRYTIQSQVRAPNDASLKALIKVGYTLNGSFARDNFRGGYMDTYNLSWLNPYRIDVLYPEGVPENLISGVERAKEALELASKVATFL